MSGEEKSMVPKAPEGPETLQERAARYGFVILESGEWVDARDPKSKPRNGPFRRFDLRYSPHQDPQGEWERKILHEAIEADAVRVFGWSTKAGERGPVVIPQLVAPTAPVPHPKAPEPSPEAAAAPEAPPEQEEVELDGFEEPPSVLEQAETSLQELPPEALPELPPEALPELHFEEHGAGDGVVFEVAPGPREEEPVLQGELAGPVAGVAHPEPASPEPERVEQEQGAEASAPKARKNAKRAQKVAADDSAPRKKAPREGNASSRKVVEPGTLSLLSLFGED